MFTNNDMIQAAIIGVAGIVLAVQYHGEKALSRHRGTNGTYLTLIGTFGNLRWPGWIAVAAGFVCVVRLLDCAVVAAALSALYLLQRGYEFADAKRETHTDTAANVRRISDAVHRTQLRIAGKYYTFLVKSVDVDRDVFTVLIQRDDDVNEVVDVTLSSDLFVPYTLWQAIATSMFLKKHASPPS